MVTYVFDGSFEGLLTAIFEFYEQKPGAVKLVSQIHHQPDLLAEHIDIISDETKATRVWTALKKKLSNDWQTRFYKTFLQKSVSSAFFMCSFVKRCVSTYSKNVCVCVF